MNEKIQRSDDEGEEPVADLITFLQSSPLAKAIAEDGVEFEIERPRDDFGRDVDFGDSDDES